MTTQSDRHDPVIASIGTSHPPRGYSQERLLELFSVNDRRIRSMFTNSHIGNRFLYLPEPTETGQMPGETSLELANKHRKYSLELGTQAIERALQPLGLTPRDVDYLICVTSTGFLCPGVTAHVIKAMGFRSDVHRADVVGMGCNAGLNALQPVANYCRLNADGVGVELCVEVCSAAYVFDHTIRTSIVNCLFGDAAAATVVTGQGRASEQRLRPKLLGFESHIITDAIDAMRFDYDGAKYSFFLDKEIPYVIGENAHIPVGRLLERFGLKRRDVAHWIVHSGGRKVIDSIKYSLDLTEHDVRHTQSVLRDFGNISSCSFLFSLDRLFEESHAARGDYVMMMTMGPGSTIECCLGEF